MPPRTLSGLLVDVHRRAIVPSRITWQSGRIVDREPLPTAPKQYLVPGLIDAHVHVESSMLIPSQFARRAVVHGTVATVSDPHEIANVLGLSGVYLMLDDAARTPVKFCFGAPSCVPATVFETAGATLDAEAVEMLLSDPRIGYLSEMMNYPGVLREDPQVMRKIQAAHRRGKPIDGHAPGLRGLDAARYFAAGISTDHECVTLEEAMEKLGLGVQIQIRQGSAARNFDTLKGLIQTHPHQVMYCTDDLHPDELLRGHIDQLVRESLSQGASIFDALQVACVNPVQHYRLPVGLLRVGDPADLLVLDDLQEFRIRQTYIQGECVAEEGECLWHASPGNPHQRCRSTLCRPEDFAVPVTTGLGSKSCRVRAIHGLDGSLITGSVVREAPVVAGHVVADPSQDLLKIAVTNRYADRPPAVAFAVGFGLRSGAMASSVAHDSHNIVALGATDAALAVATNAVLDMRGGLALYDGQAVQRLPLEVAGLMSTSSCEEVAISYSRISRRAQALGSRLRAPFMTLSFMALLVIPKLKLSDLGLFDGEAFAFSTCLVDSDAAFRPSQR